MNQRLESIKKTFLWWPMLIVLAVIILDQGTKVWTVMASGNQNPSLIKVIISDYFNIVDYRNTGAAWGMFSNNTLPLAIISLVAFIYFIFDFPSLTENIPFRKFSWAILIGGVFGNFIDRFFRTGGVVDMIEIFIPVPGFLQSFVSKFIQLTANGTYRFPAFNIADSGICVGVVLYFIHVVFFSKKTENGDSEVKAENSEEKQAQ